MGFDWGVGTARQEERTDKSEHGALPCGVCDGLHRANYGVLG
jgi:hypothetical protein